MKTERLIDLLGSNVEAARGNQIAAALVTALALGSVAAFCVMLATVGLRPGIADGAHLGFLALKLLFALSLVGIGAVLLAKMMRPGQDGKGLVGRLPDLHTALCRCSLCRTNLGFAQGCADPIASRRCDRRPGRRRIGGGGLRVSLRG